MCALVALFTPELFAHRVLSIYRSPSKLVVGVGRAVITLATRSMIAAMAIGMLVLTVMRLMRVSGVEDRFQSCVTAAASPSTSSWKRHL